MIKPIETDAKNNITQIANSTGVASSFALNIKTTKTSRQNAKPSAVNKINRISLQSR